MNGLLSHKKHCVLGVLHWSCPWQGVWNKMIFKIRFNRNHSMILWSYCPLHNTEPYDMDTDKRGSLNLPNSHLPYPKFFHQWLNSHWNFNLLWNTKLQCHCLQYPQDSILQKKVMAVPVWCLQHFGNQLTVLKSDLINSVGPFINASFSQPNSNTTVCFYRCLVCGFVCFCQIVQYRHKM